MIRPIKNNTAAFLRASFFIGVVALGITQYQLTKPVQQVGLSIVEQDRSERRMFILNKRAHYRAECERDEHILDHLYGKIVYDCASIAAQVYPFPKKV